MILISTGHHEKAQGACFDGFCEYTEANKWATLITVMLGNNAKLVPSGVLKSKVAFINSCPGVIAAIEIHFNSAVVRGKHVGDGSETLYYPGSVKGKKLAMGTQVKLSKVFGPDRGAREGWYRMNKRFGPDFFLEKTTCTSVIIEPEFIHHKEKIIEQRREGCQAIATALLDFKEKVG